MKCWSGFLIFIRFELSRSNIMKKNTLLDKSLFIEKMHHALKQYQAKCVKNENYNEIDNYMYQTLRKYFHFWKLWLKC